MVETVRFLTVVSVLLSQKKRDERVMDSRDRASPDLGLADGRDVLRGVSSAAPSPAVWRDSTW